MADARTTTSSYFQRVFWKLVPLRKLSSASQSIKGVDTFASVTAGGKQCVKGLFKLFKLFMNIHE
jgi:hypothetical protein